MNIRLFRAIAYVFALVLFCQAIWILTAEYYRPSAHDFPKSKQDVETAAANRQDAELAASFGFVRGDLWAEYAFTYLNLIQHGGAVSPDTHSSAVMEQAHRAADNALSLAPHDARVWLVLAGIDARSKKLTPGPATALRMSYYTGANEIDLIPLRLLLAVNSNALVDDDDFRRLVEHDIRVIVARKTELEPALRDVYKQASPRGQKFIEQTVRGLDPSLAAVIQALQR